MIHDDIVLEKFVKYDLKPRNGTALYDAIGLTISHVKDYKVNGQKFLVIVTDGQDNASVEFKDPNVIKEMIEGMRKDGWETIFICADEIAMKQAQGLGMDMNTVFMAQKSGAGAKASYDAVGAYATSMRGGMSKGAAIRSLNATIAGSSAMSKGNHVDLSGASMLNDDVGIDPDGASMLNDDVAIDPHSDNDL